MKKKLAVLLMFIFSALTILTGCNLFSTNNYAALNSIVAVSGDIKITREELINAYSSSGYYYYNAYGYTLEESFKKTIDDLIYQKYLIKYLEDSTDERLVLNEDDYNRIISSTWEYLDEVLVTYVGEVRSELGLTTTQLSSDEEEGEPEYAPQEQYQTKFETIDGKIVLIQQKEDSVLINSNAKSLDEALEYAINNYNYKSHIDSSSASYKTLVWKKFITALKNSQANYNYKDLSESAVFEREVEKIFESYTDSRRLEKFENSFTSTYGLDYDTNLGRYFVNEVMLNDMVNYYVKTFTKNYDEYTTNKEQFYSNLAKSSNASSYLYYGNQSEETFITVTHILIKLSDEQIAEIEEYESNPLYSQNKNILIENVKNSTLVYERDLETGEVIDEQGKLLSVMYNELKDALKNVTDLQNRVDIFNSFLYKYNVDTGIINATHDYIVGTKNSSMVETFTNEARRLYNEGKVGDISEPIYESSDSYSGFHIIMYTGTLQNVFSSKTALNTLNSSNIFEKLGSKYTSLSYKQTYFEYVYDNIAEDQYQVYSNSLVETLKNGIATVYNTANYDDLY